MPYVQRDASGHIVALHRDPPDGEAELLPMTHPEVEQFLLSMSEQKPADAKTQQIFAELDTGMIRVLEDLLDVLILKRVIMLTDLPEHAQRKILARKETRENLFGNASGMSFDNETIL